MPLRIFKRLSNLVMQIARLCFCGFCEMRAAVGVEDGTRDGDDGAFAIDIHTSAYCRCQVATLRAYTWNKDGQIGAECANGCQFLWIGSSYDQATIAELIPRQHALRDHLVEWVAVSIASPHEQILKIARACIRGAAEND